MYFITKKVNYLKVIWGKIFSQTIIGHLLIEFPALNYTVICQHIFNKRLLKNLEISDNLIIIFKTCSIYIYKSM